MNQFVDGMEALPSPPGARYRTAPTLLVVVLLGACGSPDEPASGPMPAASGQASWTFQPGESISTASLRGLCPVDDRVAWASGSGGSYGRSLDGGRTWRFQVVPGGRTFDFRDVVAFAADRAWLMSAGSGGLSRIYQTEDGGLHWRLRWTNPHPEGFLDGMAAWDESRGIAYGDPVGGHMYVILTEDGGTTWTRASTVEMPAAREGEAGFAASGTGVCVHGPSTAWIATGGANVARVFRTDDCGATWFAFDTPLTDASASSGIFSMAFRDGENGVIVGGDYVNPSADHANAAWTDDGGRTWHRPEIPPRGYRSGVTWIPGTDDLICAGPAGMDFSSDGGRTWRPYSDEGAHAIKAVAGRVYTSGARGRVSSTR